MTLQWDMGLLEDTWWHVVDYYSCVVGDARAARGAKSKMTRSTCINVASVYMTIEANNNKKARWKVLNMTLRSDMEDFLKIPWWHVVL